MKPVLGTSPPRPGHTLPATSLDRPRRQTPPQRWLEGRFLRGTAGSVAGQALQEAQAPRW